MRQNADLIVARVSALAEDNLSSHLFLCALLGLDWIGRQGTLGLV